MGLGGGKRCCNASISVAVVDLPLSTDCHQRTPFLALSRSVVRTLVGVWRWIGATVNSARTTTWDETWRWALDILYDGATLMLAIVDVGPCVGGGGKGEGVGGVSWTHGVVAAYQ